MSEVASITQDFPDCFLKRGGGDDGKAGHGEGKGAGKGSKAEKKDAPALPPAAHHVPHGSQERAGGKEMGATAPVFKSEKKHDKDINWTHQGKKQEGHQHVANGDGVQVNGNGNNSNGNANGIGVADIEASQMNGRGGAGGATQESVDGPIAVVTRQGSGSLSPPKKKAKVEM